MPQHGKSSRQSEKENRRSELRRDERVLVQFYVDDSRIGRQGTLVNDSSGGAFIETNETLPLLSKIRIEGPGLTCRAVVCRVHWLGPEERLTGRQGMGVRLISRKDHGHGVVVPFDKLRAANV